jgi:hypothetical protein
MNITHQPGVHLLPVQIHNPQFQNEFHLTSTPSPHSHSGNPRKNYATCRKLEHLRDRLIVEMFSVVSNDGITDLFDKSTVALDPGRKAPRWE